MKKALLFLGIMLSLFLGATPALAGPSVDQSNTTGGDSISIKDEFVARQAFRPAMSTLTHVKVNLSQASGTINCIVSKYNGTDWDPLMFINDQVAAAGWNTFDFPDTAMTVGGRYRIELAADNSFTRWFYGTQATDPDLYSRGYATWGLTAELTPINHLDSDFQFQTWGTDPVDIVEEQTNPGSNQDPEQTGEAVTSTTTPTASAGTSPSATTSATINPPTELAAAYTDMGKLSWKASTSTLISGYVIFRSETAGADYLEIGKSDKAVLEFDDTTTEPGKTYYYVVRSYTSSAQSANSNEATLTIPGETELPLLVESTETAANTETGVAKALASWFWYLVVLLILLVLLLAFLIVRRKRHQKLSMKPAPSDTELK